MFSLQVSRSCGPAHTASLFLNTRVVAAPKGAAMIVQAAAAAFVLVGWTNDADCARTLRRTEALAAGFGSFLANEARDRMLFFDSDPDSVATESDWPRTRAEDAAELESSAHLLIQELKECAADAVLTTRLETIAQETSAIGHASASRARRLDMLSAGRGR